MSLREVDWVLTKNQDVLGSFTDDNTSTTYDVAGFYVPTGTVNGKTAYENSEDSDQIIEWNGILWTIQEAGTTLFLSSQNVDDADLVTTWVINTSTFPNNTPITSASVVKNYGTPIKIENAVKMDSKSGTEVIVAGANILKRTVVDNTFKFFGLSETAVSEIEQQLALEQYQITGNTLDIAIADVYLRSYEATYQKKTLGAWNITSPYIA